MSLDLSTTQHWNVLCGQSSYKFALFRHKTPGMTTCRWHSLRITQGTPGLNSHRLNYNSIDDSENYLSCRHGSARWSATLLFCIYIRQNYCSSTYIFSLYSVRLYGMMTSGQTICFWIQLIDDILYEKYRITTEIVYIIWSQQNII